MLTRKQKEKIVKDLSDKFKKSKAIVLTDFAGVKVSEVQELRKKLRAEKAEFLVTKKRLALRAFKDSGVGPSQIKAVAPGSLAVAVASEIEPKYLKIIRGIENLKILGGILQGRFWDKEKLEKLADLPSREELLRKLCWAIGSPIQGLVGSLSALPRELVLILRQAPKTIKH